MYLRKWLPWVDNEKSPDDSRRFIQTATEQHHRSEGLTLGIWSKANRQPDEEDELIGIISCRNLDWNNKTGEIGYWLSENRQGQRIITSSSAALIDFGFDTLKLNRIVIRCAVGNLKSRSIPERLGFTCEGIARQAERLYDHFHDLHIYALLEDEWRLQPPRFHFVNKSPINREFTE